MLRNGGAVRVLGAGLTSDHRARVEAAVLLAPIGRDPGPLRQVARGGRPHVDDLGRGGVSTRLAVAPPATRRPHRLLQQPRGPALTPPPAPPSPPPAAAAPGSRCGAGSRAHPPPPLGICKDGARRCEVPSVTPAPAHGQLYLRGHQDGVCKPGVPNLPHKLGAGLPTLGPSPPHDQAGSQTQARPACPLLLPPTEPCPPGGHLGVCPAPWPTHRVCPHPMGGAGKPQLRELKQGAHRSPARLWVGV